MSDTPTTLQPLGPNQERWLAALESGEWQQATESLCDGGYHCCLGVGCEIFFPNDKVNEGWFGEGYLAPEPLIKKLALRDEYGSPPDGKCADSCLTELNDFGNSFAQIAATVRSNPAIYFTEPR